MTDYFATNYGDMTGYMPDCTETYVVDLIKQYDKQTNNDPVFSKMGINIPNFCTNGVDVTLSSSRISMSASGQYQTAVSTGPLDFIYISSDYGVTWTPTTQEVIYSNVSISASGQYQTVVSGLNLDKLSPGFIYISSDYGATWTQTTQTDVWRGVSISASGQYQTAVSRSEETGFIYISSDYGVTWTQTTQKAIGFGVAVNATGQYQIIAAGPETFYSTDYGNNWNQLSIFIFTTAPAISASGQVVVFATFNGVKIYNNSGFLNLSNVKPAAPSTSKGSAGDVNGMMAVNEIGLYYCSANYTSGSVDIWKRIEWSTDTW